MFPVRYGLNFYINLLRNSVFKGLIVIRIMHYSDCNYNIENSYYIALVNTLCQLKSLVKFKVCDKWIRL
jgi:hypothetical protein